jgi:hypothetical protein
MRFRFARTIREEGFRSKRAKGRCDIVMPRASWPLSILIIGFLGASSVASARAETGWKMVFPRDQSGVPRPALMQVADFDRSDPGIAGLMFRCGPKRIETVVIILDPLPPRSTATVALSVGADIQAFEALTIPTGAGLLVPFDPSDVVAGAWQNQKELRLTVTAGEKVAKAVFDLSGLPAALENLGRNCPSRDGVEH